MQIPVGAKVVILDSGIMGTVDHYDGSTVFIDVDGDLQQVHKQDIALVSDFGSGSNNEKKKNAPLPGEGNASCFLLWQAVKAMNGELQHFEVFLCNETRAELLFTYQFDLDNATGTTVRNTIPVHGKIRLHMIRPDQINDKPDWFIECWKKDEHGKTIQVAAQEGRLRAKQYVARLQSEEYAKDGAFRFDIAVSDATILITPKKSAEKEKDLFAIKKKVETEHPILQKASMPDFIDLHAEKLIPHYRNLDASEILLHQLSAFRNFLEKAIRLNMHTIYAVHGLGKGVLKAEIEKTLKKYPEVSSYNNDYTARFGFGATQINLD